MTDPNTTSSATPQSLSYILGFEHSDHVTVATHKVQRARTLETVDIDADYALNFSEQIDTWVGAQPVKPGTPDARTKASDVACVRVLYADFDRKDATDDQLMNAIADLQSLLGVAPWSIVDSGGGLHPRWKLAEPLDVESAPGVLARWKATVFRVAEENGFKADSVFDLPRVLRLPGTVNEKYSPARPVTVLQGPRDPQGTVPTSVVWSKLDQLPTKTRFKPAKPQTAPSEAAEESSERVVEVPAKPEPVDTLNERAVNASITSDMAILGELQTSRPLPDSSWTGKPWHNTCKDIAFRWAKIGHSPATGLSIDEMAEMFTRHAPRDGTVEWDADLEALWDGAVEKAKGETFELIGSGDELFADEFEAMIAGIQAAEAARPDDSGIDLSDLEPGAPVVPDPEPESPELRFAALSKPLMPSVSGVTALRIAPATAVSERDGYRARAWMEELAERHGDLEHEDYLHPHCPECFDEKLAMGQLFRWMLLHPGYNPLDVRPPLGKSRFKRGANSLADLLAIPDSDMLIDGYLPYGGVGILRGRGGASKSFLALDMALHIADPSCSSWEAAAMAPEEDAGQINEHGRVLYLAGESAAGFKQRAASWLAHHGYDATPEGTPDWGENFDIRDRMPNLFTEDASFADLLDDVSVTKPRLIVVDTLQKIAAGGDQNSASDMGKVRVNLERLSAAADGATVVVIAHTDKSDDSTRGSSALEDDADFVLHIKADEDGSSQRQLEVAKMRDGGQPEAMTFHLVQVGKSAVISSAPQSATASPMVDEEAKVGVLVALRDVANSVGADTAPATRREILDLAQHLSTAQVVQTLGSGLVNEGLVAVESDGNVRRWTITPRGRAWLESRPSSVTSGFGRRKRKP